MHAVHARPVSPCGLDLYSYPARLSTRNVGVAICDRGCRGAASAGGQLSTLHHSCPESQASGGSFLGPVGYEGLAVAPAPAADTAKVLQLPLCSSYFSGLLDPFGGTFVPRDWRTRNSMFSSLKHPCSLLRLSEAEAACWADPAPSWALSLSNKPLSFLGPPFPRL